MQLAQLLFCFLGTQFDSPTYVVVEGDLQSLVLSGLSILRLVDVWLSFIQLCCADTDIVHVFLHQKSDDVLQVFKCKYSAYAKLPYVFFYKDDNESHVTGDWSMEQTLLYL